MKNSKDISFPDINISVPTKSLITNSELKLIHGKKYALIGHNGLGKTTLLNYINNRTIPIPKQIDIFMVNQELDFDHDKTVYEIVSDANFKKNKILQKISEIESDPEQFEKYIKLEQKLKDLAHANDEAKIRKILFGLGFEHSNQNKQFSLFSGGWRMRVAIARGLYMQPTLLLLDEPTNHLDINSVIWLTDYLQNKWKKTLVIVSHDTYFINKICDKIIHIENKKLNYYNGNYDGFKKAYNLHITELEKQWTKIQKRKKEMQNKSIKREIVNKFILDNSHLEPPKPYKVKIIFSNTTLLKGPYITLSDITFGYDKLLFKSINLCINPNDKFIIFGKNGIGKSTLMQLINGSITNFTGEIITNPHVKIGYYNQHLSEILPLDKSPLEFLLSINKTIKMADAQKYLGSIGLEGNLHNKKISTLSGGQKSRVLLAQIRSINPNILLLDEPTNHLDIETIDALITAINNFNGAVMMITHNIDVIEKTDCTMLNLENHTLNETSYDEYYYNVLDEIEKF
jgi:ATP-binding cassette subfamily F protein 1